MARNLASTLVAAVLPLDSLETTQQKGVRVCSGQRETVEKFSYVT